MRRLVVIGADAAGMSAAHQALRTARRFGRGLEVIAVEMTGDTSYSQCGVPYWIAGDATESDLVVRSAAQHREMGVDLRLHHQAVGLDPAAGRVSVRDHERHRDIEVAYDDLLIATGAAPVVPDWALAEGGLKPGVHPLKTLADGRWWLRALADRPRRVIVIGGGYIGVEAAETFAARGLETTLITRRAPMAATLVPAHSAAVVEGLTEHGVRVVCDAPVEELTVTEEGLVVEVDDRHHVADLVVLALGVHARTDLVAGTGLPVAGEDQPAARGALLPDARQRLSETVWAAGDCCAVTHRLTETAIYLPLGTHANKAGRVAGENIGGGDTAFPGAVGTAITRAGPVEVARTGLQPEWAADAGFETAEATLDSTTASGYMPQSRPMSVWVLGERGTGRLLGAQITGGTGAAKRIDIAAMALTSGLTATDVAMADLAYAPPFSPVWDPVQIACRKLADRL